MPLPLPTSSKLLFKATFVASRGPAVVVVVVVVVVVMEVVVTVVVEDVGMQTDAATRDRVPVRARAAKA